MCLDLRISKNILQIGEPEVSKFKFMRTRSESKSIFAIEQKAIVSCLVENVAFLLGHHVDLQLRSWKKRRQQDYKAGRENPEVRKKLKRILISQVNV